MDCSSGALSLLKCMGCVDLEHVAYRAGAERLERVVLQVRRPGQAGSELGI